MPISQAAEESRSSVEALFASWRPSLFRYALRLCGAPDLAEDLVQEAFLALCRKSVEREDVRDPRQWTLCVVRYQVSKHLRNRERHAEELQPGEVLEAMAAGEPVDERHDAADVDRLLGVLTPREKEVILLRMESLKYRQIAARLGTSPKTIAALLARALPKLQRAADASSKRSTELPRVC
jgi:RNA polymerase sigma factor (sigma-70 family)